MSVENDMRNYDIVSGAAQADNAGVLSEEDADEDDK